jgi:class 3 adenylate cyclase
VLFADVVDFTSYCDHNSPQDVLSNLQALTASYEDLALKYDLQKIKTVGDAFMAAGGLLQPLDNPVLNSVHCGLEMIQVACQIPAGWDVRVGIHYGTVIAGLIGKRQYLFDIWGDTVNTAQRIEHYGRPGAVNLSRPARDQIAPNLPAQSLGTLEIKGKGALEIFYIEPAHT